MFGSETDSKAIDDIIKAKGEGYYPEEPIDDGSTFWTGLGNVAVAAPRGVAQSTAELAELAKEIAAPALEQIYGEEYVASEQLRLRETVRSLQPEQDVNFAAQTTQGLSNFGTKIIAGGAAGAAIGAAAGLGVASAPLALAGAAGGMLLTGVSEGYQQYQRLRDEGVDKETARKAAAIEGAVTAASVALPSSLGVRLGVKIATGVAMNVAAGGVERELQSSVLERNGYKEMAETYRWDDGKIILADAVLGAAFPAFHHLGMKAAGQELPKVDKEELDAALAVYSKAKHDEAIGVPINGKAVKAHGDAMSRAAEQVIIEDRQAELGTMVDDAEFLAKEYPQQAVNDVLVVLKESGLDDLAAENDRMRAELEARGVETDEPSLAEMVAGRLPETEMKETFGEIPDWLNETIGFTKEEYDEMVRYELDESGITPKSQDIAESYFTLLKETVSAPKGKSLSSWIRERGGIYDRGDLKAKGVSKSLLRMSPDLYSKKYGKKKGVDQRKGMDVAIVDAFDAGYFPEKGSADDISFDEFMDAVTNDDNKTNVRRPNKINDDSISKQIDQYENEFGINKAMAREDAAARIQERLVELGEPLFQRGAQKVNVEQAKSFEPDSLADKAAPIEPKAREVFTGIHDQLKRAGFDDEQAVHNATIITAAFNNFAKNAGIDVRTLWNRYDTQVRRAEYSGDNAVMQTKINKIFDERLQAILDLEGYWDVVDKNDSGEKIVSEGEYKGAKNKIKKKEKQIKKLEAEAKKLGEVLYQSSFDEAGGTPYKAETINIDGKDRTTKNSNGQPIAKTEEGLRNFWTWFGDSKVVDAQGRPLVVYHGSPDVRELRGDEAAFKSRYERLGMGEKTGAHWFTNLKSVASSYTDERRSMDYQMAEGGIVEAYIKLENPLIVEGKGNEWRDVQKRGKTSDVIKEAQKNGKDGVFIRNVKDNYTNDKRSISANTYTVFDGKQIKSVFNRGTFNPNDPRILHQSAYHGSPYRFERFDMSKIGTGEGAQAFGYGIYLTEQKAIGEDYRLKLTKDEEYGDIYEIDGKRVQQSDMIPLEKIAIEYIKRGSTNEEIKSDLPNSSKKTVNNILASVADLQKRNARYIETKEQNKGQLYKVEIPDADIERMLDWDKPLGEQSDEILNFLTEEMSKEYNNHGATLEKLLLDDNKKKPTGKDIYYGLTHIYGSDKAASEYLNSLGIVGIKYLDGTSRGKGEGTRNFVVFDQALLDKISDNIETLYQKDKSRIIQAFLQRGPNKEFLIGLTKDKDATSVMHESGHVFLEIFRDLKNEFPDNDYFRNDWSEIENYLGIKDLEAGAVIPVSAHEKWARSFEQYMKDGKSPSNALKRAFEAFRNWFLDVYKTETELGVKLTPEIKAVFDRMLATDAEIRELRLAENMPDVDSNGQDVTPFIAMQRANDEVAQSEVMEGAYDAAGQTLFQSNRAKYVTAANEAAGRELTAQELKGIEDRIKSSYRRMAVENKDDFLNKPEQERIKMASKDAAEGLKAEALKSKQRLISSMKALSDITEYVEAQVSSGQSRFEAIRQTLVFSADGKEKTQSVETKGNVISALYKGKLVETLESISPRIFGLFENKNGIKALVFELRGQDSSKVVDAETARIAKQAAKAWSDTTEAMRKRFNDAGGMIGKLEDWLSPQHHSKNLVFSAGKKKWVADCLSVLDKKKYVNNDGTPMSDAEIGKFLEKSWLRISTGGAVDAGVSRKGQAGMVSRRHAEHRAIHFKNAESLLAYMEVYGGKDFYSTIMSHVDRMATDIALLEAYGANPDNTFNSVLNSFVQKEAEATGRDPAKEAGKLQLYYDEVAGKRLPVASEKLTAAFDTVRSLQVSSKMGSAVISSLVLDPVNIRITAAYNNVPQVALTRNNLLAITPNSRLQKKARLAGIALESFSNGMNRWGMDMLGAKWASKLGSLTIRASGMSALDSARRASWGVTMMGTLGDLTKNNQSLETLNKHDKAVLKSKGITDTDFSVWKMAELEDWDNGNDSMLTMESIFAIDNNKIRDELPIFKDKQMDKLPTDEEISAIKQQAAEKLLGHILEEQNMAILVPTSKQRAELRGGVQKGTWRGEIWDSFLLFKSFSYASFGKHVFERGMNLPTGTGRAAYIGAFMSGSFILGAVLLQIQELLMGRDPKDMTDWKFSAQSFLKGGSLGIYGDFVFNTETQFGRSPFEMMAGPVSSTAADFLSLTHGNLVQAAQGKETHAGAEAVRFFKNNMPLQNLWYTKAIVDRILFNQLQEFISPGYLSRIESRARKQYGQDYFWSLSDPLPERAPDFARAIGE